MKDERASRWLRHAGLAMALLQQPLTARGHHNSTGMGPVYDGLIHFLTSPEDLIAALAVALLVGLRGVDFGRRALWVLATAWLSGCLVGLTASATNASAVLPAFWFLLLGGLVALDTRLSPRATTALAALVGVMHGYFNGAGMGLSTSAIGATLGVVCAVFVLTALAAAFVLWLQAQWARIAVRVAGSWIAASGLLMMGWALRAA